MRVGVVASPSPASHHRHVSIIIRLVPRSERDVSQEQRRDTQEEGSNGGFGLGGKGSQTVGRGRCVDEVASHGLSWGELSCIWRIVSLLPLEPPQPRSSSQGRCDAYTGHPTNTLGGYSFLAVCRIPNLCRRDPCQRLIHRTARRPSGRRFHHRSRIEV